MSSEKSSGSNIQLILIFAIPMIGVVLMTAYYFYVTEYKVHTDTHNYGVLIHPPKQSLDVSFTQEGTKAQFANHDERWTFLVAQQGSCEQECQKKLYLTRQIKEALGKYSARVQNVYLNIGAEQLPLATATLLDEEYKKHKIFSADATEVLSWFEKSEPKLKLDEADFYVVDPRGWVMMYYTSDNTYKQVIKDMKFLLKNS